MTGAFIVEALTGEVIKAFFVPHWVLVVQVHDIDGDGRGEILVGTEDGNVYVYDVTGTLVWSFGSNHWVAAVDAALDTGSRRDQVVIGSADCSVYGVTPTGELSWRWETDARVRTLACCGRDAGGALRIAFGSYDESVTMLAVLPPESLMALAQNVTDAWGDPGSPLGNGDDIALRALRAMAYSETGIAMETFRAATARPDVKALSAAVAMCHATDGGDRFCEELAVFLARAATDLDCLAVLRTLEDSGRKRSRHASHRGRDRAARCRPAGSDAGQSPAACPAIAMAYVPSHRWDVFVSYAAVDDQSSAGAPGWVTVFARELGQALDIVGGRRDAVHVFRDDALRRGDRVSEALDRHVQSSATFLALVSRGFDTSVYCQRELALFEHAAAQKGGLTTPSGLQRVIPIRLARESGRSRDSLGGVFGHDFTEAHPAFPINPTHPEFVKRVQQVASDILQMLDEIAAGLPTRSPVGASWLGPEARGQLTAILHTPALRLNDEDERSALLSRAYSARAPSLFARTRRLRGTSATGSAASSTSSRTTGSSMTSTQHRCCSRSFRLTASRIKRAWRTAGGRRRVPGKRTCDAFRWRAGRCTLSVARASSPSMTRRLRSRWTTRSRPSARHGSSPMTVGRLNGSF